MRMRTKMGVARKASQLLLFIVGLMLGPALAQQRTNGRKLSFSLGHSQTLSITCLLTALENLKYSNQSSGLFQIGVHIAHVVVVGKEMFSF